MPKQDCSGILKALSDKTRLRIVKALLREAHGVNDLADSVHISQYNASKHLRILREAGIIDMTPTEPATSISLPTPSAKNCRRRAMSSTSAAAVSALIGFPTKGTGGGAGAWRSVVEETGLAAGVVYGSPEKTFRRAALAQG